MSSDALNTLRPWLGIALLLAAARLLLAAINALARRRLLRGEMARKALHVGMGTIFLVCPWLFGGHPWAVPALAATFVGLLLAGRVFAVLRAQVASVIYGVDRGSAGEYYFPLSVAALFYLSAGKPLLFCVPLSLLTYADTAAALVGARYGSIRFTTPGGGGKSLEGSAGFAAAAFLLTHVPLLLAGSVSPAASLLIAANVAALTAGAEAACGRGIDNFVVPLSALVLLRMLLALDARALWICSVAGGWIVVVAFLRVKRVTRRASIQSRAVPSPEAAP